jgi:hypothetical protein
MVYGMCLDEFRRRGHPEQIGKIGKWMNGQRVEGHPPFRPVSVVRLLRTELPPEADPPLAGKLRPYGRICFASQKEPAPSLDVLKAGFFAVKGAALPTVEGGLYNGAC